MRVLTAVGSERIEFGPQSLSTIQFQVNLANANASAFRVNRGSGGATYINVNTSTNEISFQNSGDNGECIFLGSADVRFQGGNGVTSSPPI